MTSLPPLPLPSPCSGQRGAAAVEYLIVLSLLVLVLLVSPDAIPLLMAKLRDAYTSFVYALSLSWM